MFLKTQEHSCSDCRADEEWYYCETCKRIVFDFLIIPCEESRICIECATVLEFSPCTPLEYNLPIEPPLRKDLLDVYDTTIYFTRNEARANDAVKAFEFFLKHLQSKKQRIFLAPVKVAAVVYVIKFEKF